MSDFLNVVADISDYQTHVDFDEASKHLRGVFIKATQGVSKRQKLFKGYREKARASGMLVGAYHFAEEGAATDQADFFLSVTGNQPDELLVLDIERWKKHGQPQPPMTLEQAREFVTRIHEKTGRWPGVYGGEYLKSIIGKQPDPVLSKCWLWIAQYGPKAVWPKQTWKHWTFWQYTGDGLGPEPHDVPGIGKNIDRDKFAGSLQELEAFWKNGGAAHSLAAFSVSRDVITTQPGSEGQAAATFRAILEELIARRTPEASRFLFPNGITHLEFSFKAPLEVALTVSGEKSGEASRPSLPGLSEDPHLFSQTLRDDEGSPALFGLTPDDSFVQELIARGSSSEGLRAARLEAARNLREYPHNGCAAHLSALLRQSGINVPMTLGAGKLARILKERGWTRVDVGEQRAGDVGVTYDLDPTPPGADHIYLVVGTSGPDELLIADNQGTADAPHRRFASGRGGKTPTEYFLRA